jgi:hypothetical protein
MEEASNIDYGPLAELIGIWEGGKGMDIAPESNGTEENPYYETITYTEGGDLTNAESQVLSVVHYRQIVKRKSNDEIFHDETGYWMWDAREKVIMHSLTIPRAVCLLAGAQYIEKKDEDRNLIIEVSASIDDKDWNIIQSPFMKNNARTTSFRQNIIVGNGKMTYFETTMLDIYGKVFEHTDQNELFLQ